MQRVRGLLEKGREALATEIELANVARHSYDAAVLGTIDFLSNVPQGHITTVVASSEKPLVNRRELNAKAAEQALNRERAEAARQAAAQAQRDRELGISSSEVPKYGASALQMWPLHRPGPLPSHAGEVGIAHSVKGAAGGAAGAGRNALVYRHYAVLDSVQDSKVQAANKRLELLEATAKARGEKVTDEDRAATLHQASLLSITPAQKARNAALKASKNARTACSSIAHLMEARKARDKAVPVLTRQALETEEYLERVEVDREYDVAQDMSLEKDLRSSRDRLLDRYVGTEDAWKYPVMTKPPPKFDAL
jgi:hypothetical protein